MFAYRKFIIVALTFLLFSCAQQQANTRVAEYQSILDPLLNVATAESIGIALGAPQEVTNVGGLEVWTYYRSFGTRGEEYKAPNYSGGYTTGGREVYDKVDLTFKNGILFSYNVDVQR